MRIWIRILDPHWKKIDPDQDPGHGSAYLADPEAKILRIRWNWILSTGLKNRLFDKFEC